MSAVENILGVRGQEPKQEEQSGGGYRGQRKDGGVASQSVNGGLMWAMYSEAGRTKHADELGGGEAGASSRGSCVSVQMCVAPLTTVRCGGRCTHHK